MFKSSPRTVELKEKITELFSCIVARLWLSNISIISKILHMKQRTAALFLVVLTVLILNSSKVVLIEELGLLILL